MRTEKLLERITLNPNVMTGKPVIKGTRLTVQFILGLLAHGASVEEILEEYKGLTREDIQACLLFATESLENTTFMPLSAEARLMRVLVEECTGPPVAQWVRRQN